MNRNFTRLNLYSFKTVSIAVVQNVKMAALENTYVVLDSKEVY